MATFPHFGELPNAVDEVLIETKEVPGASPPHGITLLRAVSVDGRRMLCPRGDLDIKVGTGTPTQVTLTFFAKSVRIVPLVDQPEESE